MYAGRNQHYKQNAQNMQITEVTRILCVKSNEVRPLRFLRTGPKSRPKCYVMDYGVYQLATKMQILMIKTRQNRISFFLNGGLMLMPLVVGIFWTS